MGKGHCPNDAAVEQVRLEDKVHLGVGTAVVCMGGGNDGLWQPEMHACMNVGGQITIKNGCSTEDHFSQWVGKTSASVSSESFLRNAEPWVMS